MLFLLLFCFTLTFSQELISVHLPSGKIIKGAPNGFEENITKFLESDEFKTGSIDDIKTKYFILNKTYFDFGTDKVSKESEHQLHNIKQILKEYPDTEFEISVYTDVMEGEKMNLVISQERADSIRKILNIPNITKSVGYGQKFAVYDRYATDEERSNDRFSAISIIKK